MYTRVKEMTGEQLLLLRVVGGQMVQEMVDGELDRRARTGLPVRRRTRFGGERAFAAAHREGSLVA